MSLAVRFLTVLIFKKLPIQVNVTPKTRELLHFLLVTDCKHIFNFRVLGLAPLYLFVDIN